MIEIGAIIYKQASHICAHLTAGAPFLAPIRGKGANLIKYGYKSDLEQGSYLGVPVRVAFLHKKIKK